MNWQQSAWLSNPRVNWLYAPALTLVVLWSFVELPAESAVAQGTVEQTALWCSKLVVAALALAVGLRVRWAETVFAFICGLSLLAIIPALYTELSVSPDAFFYSLVECVVKAAALIGLVLRRF